MSPRWTLRSARLMLTPVSGADLPDLVAIKADPRVFAVPVERQPGLIEAEQHQVQGNERHEESDHLWLEAAITLDSSLPEMPPAPARQQDDGPSDEGCDGRCPEQRNGTDEKPDERGHGQGSQSGKNSFDSRLHENISLHTAENIVSKKLP